MFTPRRALLTTLAILLLYLLLRQPAHHPHTPRKHRSKPTHHSPSSHTSPQRPAANERPLTEFSHKPLRETLAYLFPYDPRGPFPTYIWQTWKTAPSAALFPTQWRLFERSWTELHPQHTHEVVSDTSATHLLAGLYSAVPAVLEAYHAMPLPVLKADFFRYLVLLARGGIYTDIDTAAIRPASEWVPPNLPVSTYGLVIGIEADPDRADWADWYSRRIQFCQWTIRAKRGHPALVEIVARITEETLARRRNGTLDGYDSNKIIEFTGPAAWTDAVFAFFNDKRFFDGAAEATAPGGNISYLQFTGMKAQKKIGDVVVLPITCFSPGVRQMGAGEDDDPMAFVKHVFDGSWKPVGERWIGDPERDRKLDDILIKHDA